MGQVGQGLAWSYLALEKPKNLEETECVQGDSESVSNKSESVSNESVSVSSPNPRFQ